MARPIRVEYKGAVYHVVARGNQRRRIFRSDKDRFMFLSTLREMIEQYDIELHCYCLMSNHYHLVIETPLANLSRALGWFQTTYSVRYNRRYGRSGHFFQGRFKAHLVEADGYAQELIRYIHLNPARLGKKDQQLPSERRKVLECYRWSSHSFYAGKRKTPEWVSLKWMRYWGKKLSTAQSEYRKFIDDAFDRELPAPWEKIRGGLVLGGDALWRKAKKLVIEKGCQQELIWSKYQLKKERKLVVQGLLSQQKNKKLQIWLRVRLGNERMIDLAHEFEYQDGSAIYKIIRRMENSAKKDSNLYNTLQKFKSIVASGQSCANG